MRPGGYGSRTTLPAAEVVSVVKNSPAEGASIRRGGLIVSVDWVAPDKWTSDEVPAYIRGAGGCAGHTDTLTPWRGPALDAEAHTSADRRIRRYERACGNSGLYPRARAG